MHQSSMFESSISIVDGSVEKMFVSSANKMYFKLGDAFSKSLIKIKNSRGPKTDPWGTPFLGLRMKN